MAGYQSLSEKYVGPGASLARIAEEHRRNGDVNAAATALEEALSEVMAESAVMLPWVCGRLASLYRSLGRLEDEERLLERYRESQTTEEGRSRLSARLTKVQAMLGRRRHRDSLVVTASGAPIDIRVRFTELWTREGGSWRMVLWHAAPVS